MIKTNKHNFTPMVVFYFTLFLMIYPVVVCRDIARAVAATAQDPAVIDMSTAIASELNGTRNGIVVLAIMVFIIEILVLLIFERKR